MSVLADGQDTGLLTRVEVTTAFRDIRCSAANGEYGTLAVGQYSFSNGKQDATLYFATASVTQRHEGGADDEWHVFARPCPLPGAGSDSACDVQAPTFR